MRPRAEGFGGSRALGRLRETVSSRREAAAEQALVFGYSKLEPALLEPLLVVSRVFFFPGAPVFFSSLPNDS